jgi:hypothetical protein
MGMEVDRMKTNEEYRLLVDLNNNLTSHRDELMQQLANATKQNVLLRDALQRLVSAKAVKDSVGKTPEYEQMRIIAWGKATLALDATADLAGLVVCDAEPVFLFRRKGVSKDFCTCNKNRFAELSQIPNLFEMKKLYKAKEKS